MNIKFKECYCDRCGKQVVFDNVYNFNEIEIYGYDSRIRRSEYSQPSSVFKTVLCCDCLNDFIDFLKTWK